MSSPNKKGNVIYEKQSSDMSWYNDAIPGGTVKNNHERIIALRKLFCHPLTITKEGQLNKKYFQNIARETGQNWSDIELLQLYEGIFKFGVDSLEKWHSIQSEFLMQRDFIEVRLKISQLLGTQGLAQYKGRSFSSEQEIKDEFEKNKKQGIENGTWRENMQLSVRPEIAGLSKSDQKELEQKELDAWMDNIYNNPHYVYRINNKRTSNTKSKGKNKNKNKNKSSNNKSKRSSKSQKNKVDAMMKAQAEKANAEMEKKQLQKQKEIEKEKAKAMSVEKEDAKNEDDMEQDDDQDVDIDIDIEQKDTKPVATKSPNKNKNKNKKKKEQQKQKQVPLIASDSEDEDMLCVE